MDKNEKNDSSLTENQMGSEKKGFLRKLLSFIGWTLVAFYFIALGLLLVLRLYAIPYLEKSKPQIEAKVTELIGMPFSIGTLKGGWDFITPIITLEDIQVGSSTPLKIKQAVLVPSYLSIAQFSPIFKSITITEPQATIERTGTLQFNILGKTVELGSNEVQLNNTADFDYEKLNLLFQQGSINVRDGTLTYADKTKEQSLKIHDITFALKNSLLSKKAALTFIPPEAISTPVTLQAEFNVPSLINPGVKDWNEQVFLSISEVNFGELAKWTPDFEFKYKGIGSGDVWVNFNKWIPSSATFIGALSNIDLSFNKDLPPLKVNFLKGKISGELGDHLYKVSTDQVEFELASGVKAPSFTSSLELTTNKENVITGGKITADRLDIRGFAATFPSLPIPENFKNFIIERKLSGKLRNVVVNWSGDSSMPSQYEAHVDFENLSSQSYVGPEKHALWIPGIKNLSGTVQAENGTGTLTINSTNADIALPGLFAVASFHFDNITANGNWDLNNKVKFKIDNLSLENSDLSFQGNGDYDSTKGEYGFLNAHGTLTRGKVASAWRYVPLIAGKETVEWLRYGLLGGTVTDASLEFTGPLHEFPYKDSELHKFGVTANFKDGVIDFYPIKFDKPTAKNIPGAIWPTVKKVGGTIFFHGDGLRADVSEGIYQNVKLNKAVVEIPSFEAETVVLTVDASATGPLPSFLNYVNTSPIKEYTADIFGKAKGTGDGTLALELTVPLSGDDSVQVNGSFAVNGAAINFNQYQIPDLTDVRGEVFFSETGARAQDITGKTWGETVTVALNTNDKGAFEVKASGRIPAAALKQVIPVEALSELSTKYLRGVTPFTLTGEILSNKVNIHVDSTLEGMAINLPAPFTKAAAKKEPLVFNLDTSKNISNIALSLGSLLDTKVRLKNDTLAAAVITNTKGPDLPAEGLTIDFSAPEVSLEKWVDVLSSLPKEKKNQASDKSEVVSIPVLNSIKLNFGKLLIDNFNQDNFHLVGNQTSNGWQAHLESNEITGDLNWNKARNGKEAELQAYLSKLYIPDSAGSYAEKSKPVEVSGGWPAINAVIQDFSYGKKNIGKIELKARNTVSGQGHLWQIQKLHISNKDATLNSSGSWLKGFNGKNVTTLLLDTRINNLGGLLDRLGMVKVIRRGNGTVKGELSWEGSPIGYNANTFDGKLNIALRRGEILKIEPGAAKLLTLLSLQSLTRYLRLDFRDFYSKGFNFDSITGSTNMENGLMQLEDLTMVGSGATVVMKGDINVKNETENLHILVLPDINATGASIALAIANPIAGIGSFLAQLIFKDPLSKLFSFEYSVTGTWTDPVVKKLDRHDKF